MARAISITVLLASTLVAVAAAAGQEKRLENSLGRTTIYVGESVRYVVFVVNCPETGKPDIGDLEDFDVQYVGPSRESRSYRTLSRKVEIEIVKHHYRLIPRKAGVLEIPAPTLEAGGVKLTGKALRLTVKKPEEQDLVFLELGATKTRVFRQQPFTVTLDILVRALPEPYQENSPFKVQEDRPNLNLPWVNAPAGLESVDTQSWLRRYYDRQGRGFTINEEGRRRNDFFPSFFDNVNTFRPEPKTVKRRGSDGLEHGYFRYRLERTFKPVKAGRYAFGGVSLKGNFGRAVKVDQDRWGRRQPRAVLERVFAVANDLSVVVTEPPTNERPPFYTGGIGSFRIWATAEPKRLKVFDPLKVTVYVEGTSGLEDVGPLVLAEQETITRQFKVVEDASTGEFKGDRKIFRYRLRPLSAEVTALPPIAFSFFDVEKGAYRTIRTDPVALEVSKAEVMDPSEVVVGKSASATTELSERREGIFANVTDVGELGNDDVRPAFWFAGLGAFGVAYVMLALLVGFVRRRNADPAAVRRRGAFGRGFDGLGAARKAGDAAAVLDRVHAAFTETVAAIRNVPVEGLTARDVGRFARDLGDETLAVEAEALLERCEAAEFGAVTLSREEAGEVVSQAKGLMERLGRRYRSKEGKRRLGLAGVLLGAVLLGSTATSARAQSADAARLFVKAQERYDRAKTEQDYLAAAALFKKILDQGKNGRYRSGAVLYNLGNAYYRAGELGRAIAAYREARRYRPGDDYLDANLRQALSRRVDKFPEAGRSLVDHILFWTRAVAYRWQFVLTLGAAALAFLIAVVRLLWPRLRGTRPLLAAALVLTLLLGAGAALSAYRYEVISRGVLVAQKTQVLKAPKGSPAFDKPLHEGTEFEVLESRGNDPRSRWYRIRFAGDRQGWIPAESAVVY
jgi:tetratricopeptide (TPR) repeat protein